MSRAGYRTSRICLPPPMPKMAWWFVSIRMKLRLIWTRRHLTELTTRLAALLRRHLLPSPIVVHHALALIGRQALEAPIALDDLLALIGRQRLEMRVCLAELLPALLGKASPLMKRLQSALAIFGRLAAEFGKVLLRRTPLLGSH